MNLTKLCGLWPPGAPKNGSVYGALYTFIYSSGQIRKFFDWHYYVSTHFRPSEWHTRYMRWQILVLYCFNIHYVYCRYLFHGTNHVTALGNYNGISKIRFWSYPMDVVRNNLIMCCQVYKQMLDMPRHPVKVQHSYLNWNTVCVRRQICKLGDSTRIYMSKYTRVQRLNERQCSNSIFDYLCLHKYKKAWPISNPKYSFQSWIFINESCRI